MYRARALQVLSLTFAVGGAACCALLLGVHAEGEANERLGSVCGGDGSGCEEVVLGRWGRLPPADIGATEESVRSRNARGIPVAALGLFYFSLLAIWFAAVGNPRGEGRARVALATLVVCALGSCVSLFYLGLMAFVVEAWCPLCVGSHAVSFVLFGLMLFAWLESKVVRDCIRERTVAFRHPSLRFSIVVFALAGAVWAAEWNAYRAAALGRTAEFAEELRQDGAYLEAVHFAQPRHALDAASRSRMRDAPAATLGVRADDPMILPRANGFVHTLVVFSDIECPSCTRFDRLLEDEILPLYAGHLRVVYKYLPMARLHPNALRGARALGAARLQGKFWEMRNLLRANRRLLADFGFAAAAERVGIDADRFVRDMSSRVVRKRIAEDRKTAIALESRSTPDVFLSGRRVDSKIRDLVAFWRARAHALKARRLSANQGWGPDATHVLATGGRR